MGKFKPHLWFVSIMILYFLTRFFRANSSDLPQFFQYYFTDLLFIPAMASFSLIFIRKLKRDPALMIPASYVLIQTIAISLFFELYLPLFSTKHTYTSDWIDVIMYFSGAVLYLFIQRFRLI